MPKVVQFKQYGGIDVLELVDAPLPEPGPGEVLVRVKATGINPSEAKIRAGLVREQWPTTFPSGQGSDLAGIVERVGAGTRWAVGDEVIGFTRQRTAHAEYVLVAQENLTAKPAAVPWEVAGALFIVGTTAYAAVRAVAPKPGETVVVSAAAGGVGSLAVQLARQTGAEVVGIAGTANHDWLTAHGVTPVAYGSDLAEQLRTVAPKIDAFIDTHGDGYVKLAVELGVDPGRIDTIADFAAVHEYGVKAEGGASAASAEVLAQLAALIADGNLEMPIAATFPLDELHAAFELLGKGHTRGKVVLLP